MGIRVKEPSESELGATKERARQRTKGELDRYLTDELSLEGYENTPLRWWQEVGKSRYPTLAGLAFTLFAAPAISSECERGFSRAGKIVTDKRYSLKADIIKADQLIKS